MSTVICAIVTVTFYDGLDSSGTPDGLGDIYETFPCLEGQPYDFPTIDPTTEGYAFIGWFAAGTDIEVTTNWVFSANTPHTLVAHWRTLDSGDDGDDDATLPLIITAIKTYYDTGVEMVYIKVESAEETPTESAKSFDIGFIGGSTLTEPFTALEWIAPQTRTPQELKDDPCEFVFPMPGPDAYFFRATSRPTP